MIWKAPAPLFWSSTHTPPKDTSRHTTIQRNHSSQLLLLNKLPVTLLTFQQCQMSQAGRRGHHLSLHFTLPLQTPLVFPMQTPRVFPRAARVIPPSSISSRFMSIPRLLRCKEIRTWDSAHRWRNGAAWIGQSPQRWLYTSDHWLGIALLLIIRVSHYAIKVQSKIRILPLSNPVRLQSYRI